MISAGKPGWESMLPTGVPEIIKEKHLFGYQPNSLLEASK
jgi:hypothetical protein